MRKLALLARLQSFYYQPGQSTLQIEGLLEDMLEDLARFEVSEVAEACKTYRTNSENRFFPTSGQLIKLMKGEVPGRLQNFTAAMYGHGRPTRNLPSVAAVLRKHGRHQAAEDWEAQKGNPTQKDGAK